mmetsp:Transcript_30427/g.56843  ORF Transcript_30427/g.56843 Transcript_30427/m.56843 type:complete len:278 (+) Transcript_30427:94-927(+)
MMYDPYDHGESIYNIIPPQEIQMKKPPMYRSKHPSNLHPSATTFGGAQTTHPAAMNISGTAVDKVVPDRSSRTMGRPLGTVRNVPDDFMKKGTKVGTVATLGEVKRTSPEKLKPSELKPKLKPDVPRLSDQPVMNLVSSKNFVVANAVEAILAAPNKVSQGAKTYLEKEDYGKVPKYLKHIKKDIEAEYDYIRALQDQEERAMSSQVMGLPEEERVSLINGLKAKWESVNTEYQASTHLVKLDTVGKVKRKEKYEAELSQIERDIEKLNREGILIAG